MHVVITEHVGWPERRNGTLIPGLHEIQSREGLVSVVSLDNGELHAVPSRCVFTPEGLRYAEEWATPARRTIHDVRIPDALRVVA